MELRGKGGLMLFRRCLAGFAVVSLVAAAMVLVVAAPARADCPPAPQVEVSPERVLSGDPIWVEGAGFRPVSKVYIHLGASGPRLATAEVNTSGKFKTRIDTGSRAPGNWELFVRGDGSCEARGRVRVVNRWCPPDPTIRLDPNETSRGGIVQLTGTGFLPDGHISVTAGHSKLPAESFGAATTASRDGSFSLNLGVPSGVPWGAWNVQAAGQSGCEDWAHPRLEVTCPLRPQIDISPNPAHPRDEVRIQGSDFTPRLSGAYVTLASPSGSSELFIDMGSTGSPTANVSLFDNPALGVWTVTIEDEYLCRASANFTVEERPASTTTSTTTTSTTTTSTTTTAAALSTTTTTAPPVGSTDPDLDAPDPDLAETVTAASEPDPETSTVLVPPDATDVDIEEAESSEQTEESEATASGPSVTTSTIVALEIVRDGSGSDDWIVIVGALAGGALLALGMGILIGRHQRSGHA